MSDFYDKEFTKANSLVRLPEPIDLTHPVHVLVVTTFLFTREVHGILEAAAQTSHQVV